MRKNNDALIVLMVILIIVIVVFEICYAKVVWDSDLPWWIKLKLM